MAEHEEGLCPRGFGAALNWPSAADQMSASERPEAYKYIVPMVVVGTVLTVVISTATLVRLILAGSKAGKASGPAAGKLRMFYLLIPPSAPVVIAILKLIIALAPRTWKLLGIAAALFEVFAFWGFLQLLLSFIGGPSGQVMEALTRMGPTQVWRACCCCCGDRVMTSGDLCAVRTCVYQFVVLIPIIAATELFEVTASKQKALFLIIDIGSLFIVVYAEISLMFAAHRLLEGRNVHAKFWTLKALFVANTLCFRVATRAVTEDVKVGNLCYTSETLASAWAAAITALLASVVAVLAGCSFTPSDLLEESERSPERVEVDEAPTARVPV